MEDTDGAGDAAEDPSVSVMVDAVAQCGVRYGCVWYGTSIFLRYVSPEDPPLKIPARRTEQQPPPPPPRFRFRRLSTCDRSGWRESANFYSRRSPRLTTQDIGTIPLGSHRQWTAHTRGNESITRLAELLWRRLPYYRYGQSMRALQHKAQARPRSPGCSMWQRLRSTMSSRAKGDWYWRGQSRGVDKAAATLL